MKYLAGLSDPLEGPQDHPNESNPTLVHKPESSPEPQVIYEAPQASSDDSIHQDTTEREEAPESSRIKHLPIVDLVVPYDPLKDHRNLPNESGSTLVQETVSSPELQKPNEALRVLDKADRRFDQLCIYVGEVFHDLALLETDEVDFIRKGKRSRPPDLDTRLIENNKYCCPGASDPSSSLCTCTGAWTTDEDP